MAEYIDRDLIEWYGCNFEEPSCENRECSGCSHAECSHSQVMQIPTADVIERTEFEEMVKSFKAMVEIKNENLIAMRDKYYTLEKEYAELKVNIKKAIEEIEQVKSVMNEEIIEHDKKDLINFIKGINQCLIILKENIGE